MDTKICTKCLEVKNHNEFHVSKKEVDGLQYYCKVCQKIYMRRHHNENKVKNRQGVKNWREAKKLSDPGYQKRQRAKYRHIQRAVMRVSYAITKGILVRPEVCSICQTRGKIDAHHPSYAKPLEVIWVCRPCHSNIHVELRANT